MKNLRENILEIFNQSLKAPEDVSLTTAQIGYNPTTPTESQIPRVCVLPKTPENTGAFAKAGFTHTFGACCGGWKGYTPERRLLQLYIDIWHLIARDGIDPLEIHCALSVIPEYRESLSDEGFFFQTIKLS